MRITSGGLLFGTWIFISSGLLFPFTEYACGQARQEQRIEGVSYSEIANWQARYGGGFYGCFPAPAPEFCAPLEIQPQCRPKKMKRRSGKK
ncbi:MAG: hypothetical protein HY912_14645 [Desulfomonile tiedjei]|uniref:Uncharacterized protein n=1 Tax=Desulfomonile tiedjei TaxID=2358 RepID=A0A9D6Z739_9BACT|nr:hypothetical protein [Desulfomonile tiedjei]